MRAIVSKAHTFGIVAGILLAAGCGSNQGTGLLYLSISADPQVPDEAASKLVISYPGGASHVYPGKFPPKDRSTLPLKLQIPNLPANDSPVVFTVQGFDTSGCAVTQPATTGGVIIKAGAETELVAITLVTTDTRCTDGGMPVGASDGGGLTLDGAGSGIDGATNGVDGGGSTGTESGSPILDGATPDTSAVDSTKDGSQSPATDAGSVLDGADAMDPARPEVADTPLGSETGTDLPLGSGGATGTGGISGSGGVAANGGAFGVDGGNGADVPLGSGGGLGNGGSGTGGAMGTGGMTGAGGVTAAGGTIGIGGSGGVTGTGGASTGGSGAGGLGTGVGGMSGSGGIFGTGGTSLGSCSPACSADQDCVGGSCVLRWGGMPCSVTPDCPSYATCCSGADETCDATRLPAGDGTNSGQYVVSADGLTVTDTITGLVWQRDGSMSTRGCSGVDPRVCTWAEAKDYCAQLVVGGVAGWRLPALMELVTIMDFTLWRETFEKPTFEFLVTFFWTSSPCAGASTDCAWRGNFVYGGWDHGAVGNHNGVVCVR